MRTIAILVPLLALGGSFRIRNKKSGSCAAYGCWSDYNRYRPCQCNSKCERYRNCCSDFLSLCKGQGSPAPSPSPPPSPPYTPSPTPPSFSPSPPGNVSGYWAGVNMNSLSSLKSRISSGARKISYSGLWGAYKSAWVNLPGKCQGRMFDIYSAKCWVPGTEQCGSFRREGDCYNREHSWPKSWWGGAKNNAYSDMFHVMPSDGYVNGKRSNHKFGEVSSVSYTSSQGHKTGRCSSGTCFEPIDAIKGVVARGHFWVHTRYGYSMTSGYKALMLKWAVQHPPEAWEKELNNRIQRAQGNRNPFIDFPNLAQSLFR